MIDIAKFIFLDPQPEEEEEKNIYNGKIEKKTSRANFLGTEKSYLDLKSIAVMSGDLPIAGGSFWMTYSGYFDGTEECPQVYGTIRLEIVKDSLTLVAKIYNVPKELDSLNLWLVIGDEVVDCGKFSKEKQK